MTKQLLVIAAAVALIAPPAVASAGRVHRNATSPLTQTFTYSLQVNPDCTLSLDSTGTVSFTAISGLGTGGAEATAVNNAKSTCAANSAYINITDASNTNSTTYTVTNGSHHISYEVCSNSAGTTCYTNSSGTSGQIGVATNGTQSTVPMYGYLPAQGINAPGTYTDLITVTLSFS